MTLNKKIIAIAGPTASGKTALSVNLAKRYNSEVISCDSMQIYKDMDIATAKVTEEEMCGIKHHLVDFLPINTNFSVSDYVNEADKVINKLHADNITPIICGGTGMYLRSLLFGVAFTENSNDDKIRAELEQRAMNGEIEQIYDTLKKLDPKASEKIHINNQKRVIRAVEYCLVTGEKFSEQSIMNEAKYDYLLIVLDAKNREYLYDRINRRVDIMIDMGLISEAREMYEKGLSLTANQTIGYKELYPYFKGEISLEKAVENIKTKTRNYAKRQLTWFRKEQNVNTIYIDNYSDVNALLNAVYTLTDKYMEGANG